MPRKKKVVEMTLDTNYIMDEALFKQFCSALDQYEKAGVLTHYSEIGRLFLWNELKHKPMDIQSAILTWVLTGKKTILTIPELKLSKAFWFTSRHVKDANRKNTASQWSTQKEVLSTEMLECVREMNYIVAVLTIDWIRREPRKALLILHRGRV